MGGWQSWLERPADGFRYPGNNKPVSINYDNARITLVVFSSLWDHTEAYPELRSDLADQIAEIVTWKGIEWKIQDKQELLQNLMNKLNSIDSPHIPDFKRVIQYKEE